MEGSEVSVYLYERPAAFFLGITPPFCLLSARSALGGCSHLSHLPREAKKLVCALFFCAYGLRSGNDRKKATPHCGC